MVEGTADEAVSPRIPARAHVPIAAWPVGGELVNFGVNRRYGAVLCRLAGVIICNSCAICSSYAGAHTARSVSARHAKSISKPHDGEVIGEPVLGGPHHVYHLAAGRFVQSICALQGQRRKNLQLLGPSEF
jgi:hypothetical protein